MFAARSLPSVNVHASMAKTVRSMATKALKEGDRVPAVTFKARVRDEAIGGSNPFKWKDITSADLFANKRVVLFSLPGAFTPTCSSTHLPGFDKHYGKPLSSGSLLLKVADDYPCGSILDEIKKLGVDEVYCLSVNDAFVMRQWGIHQGLEKEDVDSSNPLNPGNFKKVKLLPDGAAAFTRGMGMSCTWDSERGFGERSWRYSAVINNMVIEKLFVEGGAVVQNSGPDPFEVSDVNTMLTYLKSKKH